MVIEKDHRSRFIDFFYFLLVSHDEDENGPSIPKSKSLVHSYFVSFTLNRLELAVESNQSDSIDSTVTIEDESKSNSIQCDNCEENFASSEQFNQHRLHQCSLLTGSICATMRLINLLLFIRMR